ncbi:hypothetical protein SAMN04487906_3205 [Zhouia amylolytica]|uniref:Peptidase M1 membrane alanine aminopeptidase domain-containing protein n=1 Tax=Zhouia amylolytica TaxID=376730 RepID=A0A1I6VL72_9FLAO|nr:M1 family aminopeptidase [Zhouia amylolytica]SFT14453.1 hypothetical protein SAMN04487906_3205 [Zhouia amylolytica]
MLFEIIRFEIKRALQRPAVYIYWGILFLLAFAIINVTGGAFKSINLQLAGDKTFINAPGIIDLIMGSISYLGIFIIAAICSNIVLKDFNNNTLELVFVTPLKKVNYVLGRFIAANALTIMVFTGAGIGFFAGSLMPYLNHDYIGPNQWLTYINPYLTRIIPNIFFISAIFFSFSLLLRSAVINWITILGLYILYGVAMSLFKDLESQTIAALLDPFGIAASVSVSSSASATDMNKTGAQLVDVFMYNRMLWIGVGIILLVFTLVRFKFTYTLSTWSIKKKKTQKSKVLVTENNFSNKPGRPLPKAEANRKVWPEFMQLFKFETKNLITNTWFLLITLVMVVFMFVVSKGIGKTYDTNTYPVTYQVLGILGGSARFFIFIIIMIFSGEMIWRDRDKNIHEISCTYPTPRWVSYASKFLALTIGIVFLKLVMIVCGIIIQSLADYYNYELGLYFFSEFGIGLVQSILVMALAFFIHIIVNNKYLGYVFIILYWVLNTYFIDQLLKHPLLIYGRGPSVMYSDMNGWGFGLFPYSIFKLYWTFIAGILIILSIELLVTQSETNWRIRIKLLGRRIKGKSMKGIWGLASLALIVGSYIFYNTNIKKEFKTSYQRELQAVEYENRYKSFEKTPQPKISNIKLKVDLYPEKGDMIAKGTFTLKNRGTTSIDTLYINAGINVKTLEFNREVTLIERDDTYGVSLYLLKQPLASKDSLNLDFYFEGINNGFSVGGANNFCAKNGTFLYNSLFPSLGYNKGGELTNPRTRKKHGLPKRKIAADINDPQGIQHNFINNDADFVDFEAIVGTSSDQTALTPGKLIDQWKENGRNYFHYRSEHPMVNYYAILSANYQVKTDVWKSENGKETELSIYYHKGHEYNLDNMMNGMKTALNTYSKIYAPYQSEQLHIVEFPRYSSYAQSFPNMIPFSEGIGFIADLRELNNKTKDKSEITIDYPFFVTVHEVAHHWWAHQLIAADVEGAQMLMESLTQYSALQSMKNRFDDAAITKFLKNEAFKYITSRKKEQLDERPLDKVANYQIQTFYQKGILVMNALEQYLGKDTFQGVLRNFLNDYAYKSAPYPTTANLITRLKQETPDSLQYFVEDALEKITFYKTTVKSAHYKRNKDFTYTVEAKVDIRKFYINDQGEEIEVPCNDYIEVRENNSKGDILFNQKLKLKSGENNLNLKTNRKPSTLVIDPNYLIMTKEWERPPYTIEKAEK